MPGELMVVAEVRHGAPTDVAKTRREAEARRKAVERQRAAARVTRVTARVRPHPKDPETGAVMAAGLVKNGPVRAAAVSRGLLL